MIHLDKTDGLWTVTIDRPAKANSLTGDMLRELVSIARSAGDANSGAKALILTGTGRVFSAGADLDEARAGLATSELWEQLSGAIAALPGLTVAALNGTLAGGAMGMALACDLRIAVPGAKVFYPVMRLGFLPQPSDPGRMIALIGPARTKMILLAGQKITTDEAFAYGLFDRIVAPEDLMETARSLTADICAAPSDVASGISALCSGQ